MSDLAAVDLWAPIVPVPEVMRHAAENVPDEMLGYLRVFYKQPATQEAFRARAGDIAIPLERVIEQMDAAGVGRMLITGFDERASVGKTFIPNALVAPLAERHPDRFIPFAGADVLAGMPAVRDFARWVRDDGFRGLSLRPFMIQLPADDRHYYPFYAKCAELGVPLSIHTSANWSAEVVNDLGHPRHVDVVARDFPELKIIMSHGGYPWVLEAVLLAWKYPNVYLEVAAHRPRCGHRLGAAHALRADDDRGQGPLRLRLVPPRAAAAGHPGRVPRPAAPAGRHGPLARAERRDPRRLTDRAAMPGFRRAE
jgi:predicted TIM-barrel fold metal-dependent hydrolase